MLKVPVYSVLEGVDEVVESFSQSFSPFRLPVEGQEENPPAESGLQTAANDGRNKNTEDEDTHTYTQTWFKKPPETQGQMRSHSSPDPAG